MAASELIAPSLIFLDSTHFHSYIKPVTLTAKHSGWAPEVYTKETRALEDLDETVGAVVIALSPKSSPECYPGQTLLDKARGFLLPRAVIAPCAPNDWAPKGYDTFIPSGNSSGVTHQLGYWFLRLELR